MIHSLHGIFALTIINIIIFIWYFLGAGFYFGLVINSFVLGYYLYYYKYHHLPGQKQQVMEALNI